MAVRGGRPPEEGRVRTWTHVGAKQGTTWDGWIAGEAIGIHCHVGDDPSTPCLKHYLGKGSQCQRCSVMHRREWLWFQPIWRERDGKPVVVIFHADQLDVLERAKNLAFVTIGRAEEKKSGMYIRTHPKEVKFETAFSWKKQPQDISDFLPTLFKMRGTVSGPMLLAGGLPEVGCKDAGEGTTQGTLSADERSRLTRAAVASNFNKDGQPVGESFDDVVKDIAERNEAFAKKVRNGKH